MVPIGTIEVIAAHRDDLLHDADDHRRARGDGITPPRRLRRIPGLRHR